MYWQKVFGSELLDKVKIYCDNKKMSVSQLVRLAVEEYLKKGE